MKKDFKEIVKGIDEDLFFEDIICDFGYIMLECFDNNVYYDNDFEEFLADFNVDSYLGLNYIMLIDNNNDKIYNVEYKFVKNRFDDTLSDEIIMTFSKNTFYKMK